MIDWLYNLFDKSSVPEGTYYEDGMEAPVEAEHPDYKLEDAPNYNEDGDRYYGKVGYSANNTYGLDYGTPDTVDPVVQQMRNISYGGMPYTYATGKADDTNCSAFFGMGLTNSPWEGQVSVKGLYDATPKELLVEGDAVKEYMQKYLQPADLLLYGNEPDVGDYGNHIIEYEPFQHAAMATEALHGNGMTNRGVIQNGFTFGGGYESDDSRGFFRLRGGSPQMPTAIIKVGDYYRGRPELLDGKRALANIDNLYGGTQGLYHKIDLAKTADQMKKDSKWARHISSYAKDYIDRNK